MSLTKIKKKFTFDVSWVFTGLLVALVIRLLRKIVLARYLGPTELGLFSMCIMLGGIYILIASFGFESAVVKYTAEYKDCKHKLSQLFSSAILTMIFFGVISSIILFVLSDTLADIFNMPSISLLLKIFSLTIPFTLILTIVFGFLNGLREMKYFSYVIISRSSFSFIAIIILVLVGLGVRGAILGYVLAEIVIACIFFVFVRKCFCFTTLNYKQTTKKLASFGSRMVCANAVSMMFYEADILLIGYFLTATDVGYYAIAVALSRFFWLIPQSIQKITYPLTTEYWSADNLAALQKMLDKSMKYTACFLLPVGLGVGFFAWDIVILIVGREFVFAVSPLLVLLVGTLISGIVIKPIGGTLAAIGRPDLDMKVASISAVVNIILNVLLIPRYGIIGAAIASSISLTIGAFIFLKWCSKLVSLKIDIEWYIRAITTVTLAIISFFIFKNLINPFVAGFIILYIFIIMCIKVFLTKEDRTYFLDLISEMKTHK